MRVPMCGGFITAQIVVSSDAVACPVRAGEIRVFVCDVVRCDEILRNVCVRVFSPPLRLLWKIKNFLFWLCGACQDDPQKRFSNASIAAASEGVRASSNARTQTRGRLVFRLTGGVNSRLPSSNDAM
jgi:hypothetical protein